MAPAPSSTPWEPTLYIPNDPRAVTLPPRRSRHTAPDAETGRGLTLVHSCADAWCWVHQRDT
ncbi:hypothetical protein [Streptomyces sp. NPDC058614]|uniref:hypothetical protein n=1 Tax=Streptomyces sp. NPDC058614 TaxID=3346557 RepID=UPI0036522EB8